MAMGEPKRALIILTESLEKANSLGYHPYLPFELKWAAPLFDYASRKKVNEAVVEFLKQRGFIAFSPPLPKLVKKVVKIRSLI